MSFTQGRGLALLQQQSARQPQLMMCMVSSSLIASLQETGHKTVFTEGPHPRRAQLQLTPLHRSAYSYDFKAHGIPSHKALTLGAIFYYCINILCCTFAGAQQQAEKEQSRAQNDDAAHTAMPDDTGMNEALEEPATATAARAKQKAKPAKPAKKAPAKKSPTKRAAPKAKQSKAAKAAEPAAAKRAQDGKRRAQTRAQKAAVTRKPSPQPSADPEADDHDDPSMPLPPLNMQPQVAHIQPLCLFSLHAPS